MCKVVVENGELLSMGLCKLLRQGVLAMNALSS